VKKAERHHRFTPGLMGTCIAGFTDLNSDNYGLLPLTRVTVQPPPLPSSSGVSNTTSAAPAVLDLGILFSQAPNTSYQYNTPRVLILTADTAWPSEQQLQAWATSSSSSSSGTGQVCG
jgi:hypothetical protein